MNALVNERKDNDSEFFFNEAADRGKTRERIKTCA